MTAVGYEDAVGYGEAVIAGPHEIDVLPPAVTVTAVFDDCEIIGLVVGDKLVDGDSMLDIVGVVALRLVDMLDLDVIPLTNL